MRFAKKGHKKSNDMSYLDTTGENLYKIYKKYNILIWILFLLPIGVTLIIGDLDYYSTYLARYMIVDIPEEGFFQSKRDFAIPIGKGIR